MQPFDKVHKTENSKNMERDSFSKVRPETKAFENAIIPLLHKWEMNYSVFLAKDREIHQPFLELK